MGLGVEESGAVGTGICCAHIVRNNEFIFVFILLFSYFFSTFFSMQNNNKSCGKAKGAVVQLYTHLTCWWHLPPFPIPLQHSPAYGLIWLLARGPLLTALAAD